MVVRYYPYYHSQDTQKDALIWESVELPEYILEEICKAMESIGLTNIALETCKERGYIIAVSQKEVEAIKPILKKLEINNKIENILNE